MSEFEMVMPFVVVASHGGPYDDSSFVAGFRLGRLDAVLSATFLDVLEDVVETAAVPQLDLIAMHHGFALTAEACEAEGWTSVRLTRGHPVGGV